MTRLVNREGHEFYSCRQAVENSYALWRLRAVLGWQRTLFGSLLSRAVRSFFTGCHSEASRGSAPTERRPRNLLFEFSQHHTRDQGLSFVMSQ